MKVIPCQNIYIIIIIIILIIQKIFDSNNIPHIFGMPWYKRDQMSKINQETCEMDTKNMKQKQGEQYKA
jgi:hypothetical protein